MGKGGVHIEVDPAAIAGVLIVQVVDENQGGKLPFNPLRLDFLQHLGIVPVAEITQVRQGGTDALPKVQSGRDRLAVVNQRGPLELDLFLQGLYALLPHGKGNPGLFGLFQGSLEGPKLLGIVGQIDHRLPCLEPIKDQHRPGVLFGFLQVPTVEGHPGPPDIFGGLKADNVLVH